MRIRGYEGMRIRGYEGTRVSGAVPAQKVVPYYADSDAYYCISKAMPHPVASEVIEQVRVSPCAPSFPAGSAATGVRS